MRCSAYRLPPSGSPFRLAFVGQSTFFEACSLGDELAPAFVTTFVEYRAGADPRAMLAAVGVHRPHAVVVFRPELVPPGLFEHLDALTIGFLTEPIPRVRRGTHPDLKRRLEDLRAIDPSNFDRLVSFDPLIAETAAEVAPVWRSLPLPVSDRYFAALRPLRPQLAPLFVGRSTPHREAYLTPLKHRFDLLHVAHGAGATMLERLLAEHDVGVNLHNEPYLSFENRVCLHLAAGHLVLTEPLSPTHGLEPGIDYLEVVSPEHLTNVVTAVRGTPEAFEDVRLRGRMKAELYRASAVYPRLLHDAALDVDAFGSRKDSVYAAPATSS